MTSINSFVTVCCMVPKFGAGEFNSCWSGKWQSTGYMVRNCQCVIMPMGMIYVVDNFLSRNGKELP